MADYKAMYYRLAEQMDTAIDILDTNTVALTENAKILKGASGTMQEAYQSINNINGSLIELNQKIKARLLETEEMYMNCEDVKDIDK